MKKFYTRLLGVVAMTLLGTSAFAQVTGISADDYSPCHNGNVTISWSEAGDNSNVTVRIGTGTSPANTDLVNISSYPTSAGSNTIVVSGFVGGATYNIDIIGNQDATTQSDAFTVDARPTAATSFTIDAAVATRVCANTTFTLAGTGGSDGDNGALVWYQTDGTTLLGTGVDPNTIVGGIAALTNYKVRREDAVCGDNTAFLSVNVDIYATPSAATDVTLDGASNPLALPCPGTYTLGQTGANLTNVSPLTTVQYSVVSAAGGYVTNYNFPSGATTVYVRVDDGCTVTNYDYSEVVTMNTTSVDGTVSPDVTPFCAGATIRFTAVGQTVGIGGTYEYSQDGGANWAPTLNAGADDFIDLVLAATTTVAIRIVDDCITTAGVSGTAVAYVNSTNLSSVSASPSTDVCAGTAVVYTATGGSLGDNPATVYEYQVNLGGYLSNGTSAIYPQVVNVTTTIDFRINDGCTGLSAPSTVTTTVASNNVQPTTITTTPVGPSCADTVDFQANGTLSNYTVAPAVWQFSTDNFATILGDSTDTYTKIVNADLTMYARIVDGCGSQGPGTSIPFTIIPSSVAPTSITVTDASLANVPDSTEICVAQMVTLTQIGGTADAGDGAMYEFGTIDNGTFTAFAGQPQAGSTYSVSHTVDTTYAVRLVGGCTGTSTEVIIATLSKEDNVAPTMITATDTNTMAVIPDGSIVCGQTVITYVIDGTLGDDANFQYDYWVDGNPFSANTGADSSLTLDLAAIGAMNSLVVTGYIFNGCNDVSGSDFTHNLTVYSTSSGFTAISLTNDDFCANAGVVATMTASGAVAPANANIAWYILDNNTNEIVSQVKVLSSTDPEADSIMVSPTITTTYGVRMEGCDTTVFEVRSITVRDTSIAPTGVSISPNDTVCVDMPVSFSATGGAAGFGATLEWYNAANTLMGTGNPLFLTVTQDTAVFVRYAGFCNTTPLFAAAPVSVYDSNDVTVNDGGACASVTLDLNVLVSPLGGSFAGTGVSGHFFNYATPGVYTIDYTKTFPGGCSFTKSFDITVTAGPEFSLTLLSTPTACGGDGSFLISGNDGDFYDVNSGDYTGNLDGDGEAIISAPAGGYTVVVTDGCSSTDMITIPNPPGGLSATYVAAGETCFDANNGSITVNATGGTSPYTYSIDGGSYGASNVFGDLAPGLHDIDVMDNTGCSFPFSNIVVDSVDYALDLTVEYYSNLTCFGSNDGVIEGIFASGGTAPYMYSINGDDFGVETSFDSLAAGNYTITVQDAGGCEMDFSFSIEAPDQITATMSPLDYDENTNTYDIEITREGGTGALLISLNGGTPTLDEQFNDLAPGVYTWTITDDNNCTVSGEFELLDPTSVGSTQGTVELSVYPNPFANNITVAGDLPVNASVVLVDVYGKQVSVNTMIEAGKTVINTDQLAKGMYILNISGDGVNVSKKLIKN